MGQANSIEHRGGRPKGALNFRTKQIQAFCRSVCEDPLYRKTVIDRARSGTLGPMEPVILAYAYGKPKESIDLHVGPLAEDLSALSIEELAQRAEAMTQQLREARELEAALPAEYRTGLSSESYEVAKTPAISTQSSAVDANPTERSADGQNVPDSARSSAANEEPTC